MKTRALGRTGRQVTELGFGCAAIANRFAPVRRDTAMARLQTVWDGGMRTFDTAPDRGATGDFRNLSAGRPARRDQGSGRAPEAARP